MKRPWLYPVSVLLLVLVTTLAVGLDAPDALYNRYSVWARPVIANDDDMALLREAGVVVIWYRVEANGYASLGIVGKPNSFPPEQADAIGRTMGTIGRRYNLQGQFLFLWSGRPQNAWTLVFCEPAGCQPAVEVSLRAPTWQAYILDAGWVR